MKRKDNMSYKYDTLGVFADPSESHRAVVYSLLAKNYTETWIAKSTGLPEATVRKLADAWRASRK